MAGRSLGSMSGDDADARDTFERLLLTVNEALADIDQGELKEMQITTFWHSRHV